MIHQPNKDRTTTPPKGDEIELLVKHNEDKKKSIVLEFFSGTDVLEQIHITPSRLLKILQAPAKPTKKVDVKILDLAARAADLIVDESTIGKIIDLIDLIESKGDQASLKDIASIQRKWYNPKF